MSLRYFLKISGIFFISLFILLEGFGFLTAGPREGFSSKASFLLAAATSDAIWILILWVFSIFILTRPFSKKQQSRRRKTVKGI
ncbi:MAG TPA: hypothetical protein VI731_10670 [Bacteroidia bacterium]|nr:hypothetical protein [Bacteroidia bacterium]